jgi:hypothetical protein
MLVLSVIWLLIVVIELAWGTVPLIEVLVPLTWAIFIGKFRPSLVSPFPCFALPLALVPHKKQF